MNTANHRIRTPGAAAPGGTAAGFTLLELAIVLAVIGLIISAVTVGRDLYRNAQYQRISSTFVQGWQIAYDTYTANTGVVPGDAPSDPGGEINGDGSALCNGTDDALLNTFLAAGVELPEGRAEGQNDRYVYQDSNGNPQEVQVCFRTVEWAVPGSSVDNYVTRERNVMVIRDLTPSLARHLDAGIDGKADARFGRFREDSEADSTGTTGVAWSVDDRMAYGDSTATAEDEDQVTVVTAYYRMNR
ncbi:prepilin-type N-terminal cleavage/methylation domain-containing protein [Arhodomonas aquaeolei]|uniref:type II secretion system protein n=1 Tax=Arhodomonas aquaeolei TaxID=2369 RepID=UPI00216745D6|nr:prepilin-type N-terminal cleavage/methylation domain-containing protein [Arhodomonas aquaeolei]MCS4504248.1 prepilin-type N-terminal cleavage/methylation domain-containing protein [Arhodomonas aquaeolei]